MWGKIADTMAAQQIELIIHQLDSISILPCVVARFLSQLLQTELLTPETDDIIKSDPVLTARVISIAHQRGLSFGDGHFSVSQALDKLSAHIVRDAVLSVKVYQGFDRDDNRISFRKQLVRHAIAVACCAKEITEAMLPQMDSELAYCAGLLHNIGNLALDDAMPKSFARMVEEAKSQGASISAIEQKHLGADYTILGKRLAQKWQLPEQITLAIWLHQSDAAIVENMPEAGIAQVVRLADTIARQCGIGESGSYDSVDLPVAIIQSLSINIEQLEQIPGT
jgi:HD-like signal output (HDOD) protein